MIAGGPVAGLPIADFGVFPWPAEEEEVAAFGVASKITIAGRQRRIQVELNERRITINARPRSIERT